LRGKPFGVIISQYLGLKMQSLSLANSHPIRSLIPELTPKNGDIVTLHDILPFIKVSKFMTGSYDKKSYNLMYGNSLNARMLVSSTKFGKEELMRELKIEAERIAAVYESIDHSKFYPDGNNPYPHDGKIHLVTVGDFNPRKRFDPLFKIISRNRDMTLCHIGPVNSWKERAEMLRETASKARNIKLLGAVDDKHSGGIFRTLMPSFTFQMVRGSVFHLWRRWPAGQMWLSMTSLFSGKPLVA